MATVSVATKAWRGRAPNASTHGYDRGSPSWPAHAAAGWQIPVVVPVPVVSRGPAKLRGLVWQRARPRRVASAEPGEPLQSQLGITAGRAGSRPVPDRGL